LELSFITPTKRQKTKKREREREREREKMDIEIAVKGGKIDSLCHKPPRFGFLCSIQSRIKPLTKTIKVQIGSTVML